jgi:hypothetical protein
VAELCVVEKCVFSIILVWFGWSLRWDFGYSTTSKLNPLHTSASHFHIFYFFALSVHQRRGTVTATSPPNNSFNLPLDKDSPTIHSQRCHQSLAPRHASDPIVFPAPRLRPWPSFRRVLGAMDQSRRCVLGAPHPRRRRSCSRARAACGFESNARRLLVR